MTVTQNDCGGHEYKKKHWGPERHVIINREPGRSLGLSIVGGNVDVYNGVSGKYENISGIFIKHITPGSPADRTKKLQAGDRIIEVDGINLVSSTHEHAVELIQIAGNPVHLLVQSLECFGAGDDNSVLNHRKSRITDHRIYNGSRPMAMRDDIKSPTSSHTPMSSHTPKSSQYRPDTPEVIQEGAVSHAGNSIRRNVSNPIMEKATTADEVQQNCSRNERRKSISKSPPQKSDESPLPSPESLPQSSESPPESRGPRPQSAGSLPQSPGPVLHSTGSLPNSSGSLPRSTGSRPQSPGPLPQSPEQRAPSPEPRAPTPESLNLPKENLVNNAQSPPEPAKLTYSSEESSEDEDTRDQEGNIYTKAGVEISRKSAGNVKRSPQEIAADPEEEDQFGYTTRKIQKKYKALGGNAIMVTLNKERRGLGIALSGHRDRSKMAVFVCGLNPNGTAFKTGGFVVGDELLEVNGQILQNRCHLNASSLIKSLPGTVFKFIVLRKTSNIHDLAVKPVTQFSSDFDEDGGCQFSQYKGVRTVLVKKGQYGLGIMIIEGKHAEVGRGIFVSDIQEGSAAEEAGLQVGDLILSVNFDPLLGWNYDDATNLLKKTEGVVTLIVCNPNQKKIAQEAEAKAKPQESETKNEKAMENVEGPNKTAEETNKKVEDTEKKTEDTEKKSEDANKKAEQPAAVPKPEPAKEPAKPKEPEPPADPKTCKIIDDKETTIEFNREKDQPIGLDIVGGSDTSSGGVFILDVYPDGTAGKDGRLKPGDRIIDFCHQSFKAIAYDAAYTAVFKSTGSISMTVLRQESAVEEIEVELQQKPGKGVGLCIIGLRGASGAYVSELIPGTSAAENGNIFRGDRIVAVCGEDVREATVEDIAILMKGLNPVKLKLARYKSK